MLKSRSSVWEERMVNTAKLWDKPISINLWWIWFLSGLINDLPLYNLIINTLITSKRGYANINTKNNAWFRGRVLLSGWLVFNQPRERTAIVRPSPSDPVSPKNIFLDLDVLKKINTNKEKQNEINNPK